MKFALVGIGDAATHHAKALVSLHQQGVLEFTSVVARDAAKFEAFRAAVGVPARVKLESRLDALSGVDAVVLATPDGLHAEQVITCVQRGFAVLVEKPLALTTHDGALAVDAARKANVCLHVGYQLRHHPAHVLMHQRLSELGRLRSLSFRWAWPDPNVDGWRARGTNARFWSLAALGTHAIDLAVWFGGAAVSEVNALRFPAEGIDRAAEVSLRLADEVSAHVSVAVTHRAISRVVITGEQGEFEALGTLGARGDGALTLRLGRADSVLISYVAENPYLAQLRAFTARVLSGFIDDAALLSNLSVLDGCAAR
jgi:predicted dehydrogenase